MAGREDAVAPLLNQFQMGDKHYIILTDDLKADYGLPNSVDEVDIGEKITDITTSPDKNLIGSEVYEYIPAGGEAVVAVKKDIGYQLFRFFTFESYNNNQNEDSVKYLALYGISKADDIAKIQFIGHSEQSKLQGITDIRGEITDRGEISRFYNYYSVLKNSSDKYFDKLFNYNGTYSSNKSVEIGIAASDKVDPSAAVEPNMTAPDQIGYDDDLPINMASDQTEGAERFLITDKGESGAASATNTKVNETPTTDLPFQGMVDMGGTGVNWVEPIQGSAADALSNPITIRIYNHSGVYYGSIYYLNIGFISRYEVNQDFADFMDGCFIK